MVTGLGTCPGVLGEPGDVFAKKAETLGWLTHAALTVRLGLPFADCFKFTTPRHVQRSTKQGRDGKVQCSGDVHLRREHDER